MHQKKTLPKFAIALLILLVAAFILLSLYKANPSFFAFLQPNSTNSENHDTTPPVISSNINTMTVLPGETLTIEKLGIRATDSSPIESIAFTKLDDITFFSETFQFSYGGTYALTVSASDTYGNTSDLVLTIKVETPPEIEAPSDFYVAVGNKVDYSKYVQVSDLLDESISFETLNIDTSECNIAIAGDYPVSFSATDNYGLTSTKKATVHVRSKADLQKLIDTQIINMSSSVIVGATNAYDIGVYDDKTLLEGAIAPALVIVSNEKNNTAKDGFIIKIDDAFVTIATQESAVTGSLTVDLAFFDGTTRKAAVVFTNEEYNLAFLRIPVDGATEEASVSSDYVRSLRTVHLEQSQWDMHPVTKAISLEQVLRHYELVFKHKLQK